jgi:hypothetical protein
MSTVDIRLCIETSSQPNLVAKTLQKTDTPFDHKDGIVANVVWRYLTVRG